MLNRSQDAWKRSAGGSVDLNWGALSLYHVHNAATFERLLSAGLQKLRAMGGGGDQAEIGPQHPIVVLIGPYRIAQSLLYSGEGMFALALV